MKKGICLFLAVTVILSLHSMAFASDKIDAKSIIEKKIEIAEKYDYGEELSEEDAEFIKTYADIVYNDKITRSVGLVESEIDSLFRTDMTDSSSGVSIIFTGSLVGKINPASISDNNYGIKSGRSIAYGTNKSRLISQKIVAECTCYGIAGSGGLIKVYDGSINSGTQTTEVVTMNKTQNYSAVMPTYATVSAYVDVVAKTASGNGTSSFRVLAELM